MAGELNMGFERFCVGGLHARSFSGITGFGLVQA